MPKERKKRELRVQNNSILRGSLDSTASIFAAFNVANREAERLWRVSLSRVVRGRGIVRREIRSQSTFYGLFSGRRRKLSVRRGGDVDKGRRGRRGRGR